jgi:hypothetical protein
MDIFGLSIGLTISILLTLGFAVVALLVAIFFLLSLQDLLRQVHPGNRAMRPGEVWLNLIPVFNLVWIFITVIRVRDSVEAEFRSRGWAPQGDFGFGVGLAAAILTIVSWGPLGLAALICWIVYWVRTSELRNQMRLAPAGWVPAQQGPGATAPVIPVGSAAACPYCGTAHGPGARFCSSCGRPVV